MAKKRDYDDDDIETAPVAAEPAPAGDKLEERRREGKIFDTSEGPYHGYSQQQVERMEAERNPLEPVPTEESAAIPPNPEPEPVPEPVPEPEPEPDPRRAA